MNETMTVVTVLGDDKPGIIARVASTLADAGANIIDINQTVLEDIFTMTMRVAVDEDITTFNEVQEALNKDAQALNMQIVIQREDIFKAMYNI